jgi:hypothetical protein
MLPEEVSSLMRSNPRLIVFYYVIGKET